MILWKWLREHSFLSEMGSEYGSAWWLWNTEKNWEAQEKHELPTAVGIHSPEDDGRWLCQEPECPLPWVDLVHVVFVQQFFPNDHSGCFLSGLSVVGWVHFNRTSFLRDKMYFQLIASVLRFSLHFPTPWAVPLSGGQRYLLELSRKWYREQTDRYHPQRTICLK